MKALILAGGFATRLWPLSENRAKPLLLVGGKTILEHLLEKIPKEMPVYLLINKKFEADFIQELEQLGRKNAEIFLEDAMSDSGKVGALKALSEAIKHYEIDDNIAVFAGDNLLPNFKMSQLIDDSQSASLVVHDCKDLYAAKKFGVVEIREIGGKWIIADFEEKPQNPKGTLVSTSFMSLGKKFFPNLHDLAEKYPDRLGEIIAELIRQKKTVWASLNSGDWFDVGSFESYLEAHKSISEKPVSKVFLEKNHLSGKVFIGEGSVVENCRLTDCIIYPNNTLKNCHISQSALDESCILEGVDLNNKIIRKGTNLINKTNGK